MCLVSFATLSAVVWWLNLWMVMGHHRYSTRGISMGARIDVRLGYVQGLRRKNTNGFAFGQTPQLCSCKSCERLPVP